MINFYHKTFAMAKIKNSLSQIKIAKLLYKDISTLTEQSRIGIALAVNKEITMLYWQIGKTIKTSLLKNKRAGLRRRNCCDSSSA